MFWISFVPTKGDYIQCLLLSHKVHYGDYFYYSTTPTTTTVSVPLPSDVRTVTRVM